MHERGASMNVKECEILKMLLESPYVDKQLISDLSGNPMGVVDRCVRSLTDSGHIDESMQVTNKGRDFIKRSTPRNAIILAAGTGQRMIPINTLYTKGMLEVGNVTLIERLIRQLQAAGVNEIHIVVGFMKEEYEALGDKYNVHIIPNRFFRERDSLYSLSLAADYIGNSYILPCDLWCRINPFSRNEMYSWYMVSEIVDDDSFVRVDNQLQLNVTAPDSAGNTMMGIGYISDPDAEHVRSRMSELLQSPANYNLPWEYSLVNDRKLVAYARNVRSCDMVDVNTYEQLRGLDDQSNQLKSYSIAIIMSSLGIKERDITEIALMKKGVTNRSFIFTAKKKRYIMRIPGEGTNKLINRRQEALVYDLINGKNICDDVAYINPDNGYKITRFINNARTCDPYSPDDVKRCIEKLRWFHKMNLQVSHSFDIYRQIEFYQSLWEHDRSVYEDYRTTKSNVHLLKSFIDAQPKELCLSHIDAVHDNFLLSEDEFGNVQVRIIDWEYAGMQDPHVDIAMFCVDALYDRKQIDDTIDLYFKDACPPAVRAKIYCYISVCGLLRSNWCEFRSDSGVELGEYARRQYQYATDFYEIAKKAIDELN